MKTLFKESKAALSLALVSSILGCSTGGNAAGSGENKIENNKEPSYRIVYAKEYTLSAGLSSVVLSQFDVCSNSEAKCASVVLIANSKNEVKAKLQSAAPGNLPLEEIPTSEYLDARKTYPLVMAAPSININALNKNVSALNDQMLARCRSTKDWTRMMQVKNSARTSLYFHYTNERILNSKTVIRLDVKTGDVQTFDTKDDLFSDKSGGPSLVVNATDANGDLLIDNAAILFERHQTKCRDAYGYLRASLSPFNPDVDAEASSLLESYLEREPTSWRPNFPGTLLPDTVSLSWFNKDISTQDKQYIKPDPYADSYWNK